MTCKTKRCPAWTMYAIRKPSGAQAIATTLPSAGWDQARRPSGAIATRELPMPAATYSARGDNAAALTVCPSRPKPSLVTTESRPSTIAATPFAPCGSTSCVATGCGFDFAPKLTCSAPAAASEPAAITSRTTAAANARTAARSPRLGAATGRSARSDRCNASSRAPGSGSGASASTPSSRRSSSLDMLDLQRLAQLLERPCEAGVDRPHREIECSGDLLRRHPDPVAEDDDHAALERKLDHRREKAAVSGRMCGCEVRRVGQLLVGEAAFRTQQVERAVGDDPVQPRPERAPVVEASERGERPLEAVRGHVVRQRAPPGERVRSAPGIAPVAAEERGRSFAVAAAGLPHEVSVTRFTHSSEVSYE